MITAASERPGVATLPPPQWTQGWNLDDEPSRTEEVVRTRDLDLDHDEVLTEALDGFAYRVLERRVDLLSLIKNGRSPLDWLPASDGMLIRGKRHLIVAPKKQGKSISMLVHLVDMALSGARVIVLDRENGAGEYARRLEGIIEARALEQDQQQLVAENRHAAHATSPARRPGHAPASASYTDGRTDP